MPTVHNVSARPVAMPAPYPPRAFALSGQYVLFCDFEARLTLACELAFNTFPEMKITGGGRDSANNRYAVQGTWDTRTNAFVVSLDLVKLGKSTAQKGNKPPPRTYPTIQLFGLREPMALRFSGEAHTCMGVGPFMLTTTAALKQARKDKKVAKNGRATPPRTASLGLAQPWGFGSPAGSPHSAPRTPPVGSPNGLSRSPQSGNSMRSPQHGITSPNGQRSPPHYVGSPQYGRPRAASNMSVAAAQRHGYPTQGQREFAIDQRAFAAAHAHSQHAAMEQAQARARARSDLGRGFSYTEETMERDSSADGFDDEAFEALLVLSPCVDPTVRLEQQRAALERFKTMKAQESHVAQPTQPQTTPVRLPERELVPEQARTYAADGPISPLEPVGPAEPALPSDGPAPVTPRPEWMDEVFEEDTMFL